MIFSNAAYLSLTSHISLAPVHRVISYCASSLRSCAGHRDCTLHRHACSKLYLLSLSDRTVLLHHPACTLSNDPRPGCKVSVSHQPNTDLSFLCVKTQLRPSTDQVTTLETCQQKLSPYKLYIPGMHLLCIRHCLCQLLQCPAYCPGSSACAPTYVDTGCGRWV